MENLIRAGRCFYGIGIAGIGIQQFIYADFRPMLLPYWPSSIPGPGTWSYITGAALVLAGVIISFSKRARMISIVLGILFSSFFSPRALDKCFKRTGFFRRRICCGGFFC